jgi:hypothetical protein
MVSITRPILLAGPGGTVGWPGLTSSSSAGLEVGQGMCAPQGLCMLVRVARAGITVQQGPFSARRACCSPGLQGKGVPASPAVAEAGHLTPAEARPTSSPWSGESRGSRGSRSGDSGGSGDERLFQKRQLGEPGAYSRPG